MYLFKIWIAYSLLVVQRNVKTINRNIYVLIVLDRDECSLPVCSQTCTDTEGSYTCGCHIGYKLSADKTTCTGIRLLLRSYILVVRATECEFPSNIIMYDIHKNWLYVKKQTSIYVDQMQKKMSQRHKNLQWNIV